MKIAIDGYIIKKYESDFREHLGASQLGRECKRELWYAFRWCFRSNDIDYDNRARMLRLWNRGFREEDKFVEYLEGIGCKVYTENYEGLHYHPESNSYYIEHDENKIDELSSKITEDLPEFKKHIALAKLQGLKFPQFRISFAEGHGGGSYDGICYLPPSLGYDKPILLEFKTNKTGPEWVKLEATGVELNKPVHFAQMSIYGSDPTVNIEYGLYMNINKNDDTLHIELVKLNHDLGRQMRAKAENIILSQEPPTRLSDNISFFKCVYCEAKFLCHRDKMPEKNCRSCKFASPGVNATWQCSKFGKIPKEFIKKGCAEYFPITSKEL